MTNKAFFIQQWTAELKATLGAIRAVPQAKWDYKPSPKTRSAFELLSHITDEINDMLSMATTGAINHTPAKYSSTEEIATTYETKCNDFLTKLATVSDSDWENKIVPMSAGGHKLHEAPMTAMAWTYLKDLIHHRGQLSTYFRPMGVRNPSIYGPTAESMEEMMAAKN